MPAGDDDDILEDESVKIKTNHKINKSIKTKN